MSTSEESGTESEESCEETKVPVHFKKDASSNHNTLGSEDESSDVESDAPGVSKSVSKNLSKSGSGRAVDAVTKDKQSENDRSSDNSDSESGSSVESNLRHESDVSRSDSESEISQQRANSKGPSRLNEKSESSEKNSESSGEESSTGSGQRHNNIDNNLRKFTKVTDKSSTSDSDNIQESDSDSAERLHADVKVKEEPLEQDEHETTDEENGTGTSLLPPDDALISPSSGVISLENLQSNSDLWIIHCPDSISEKDLEGAKLDFDSDTRIKFGGRRFHATPYPENGTVACVLPSHITQKYFVAGLPVKGCVLFEETIKLPKALDLDKSSEVAVKFPKNLKVRHPLFGADYQERLKKGLAIKKLLKKADKRRSKSRESSRHEKDSFIVEKDNRSNSKKDHTDKRKSSDHSENNLKQHELQQKSFTDYGNGVNDKSVSPEKKKKRKLDRGSESGRVSEANGFDDLRKAKSDKKRKLDSTRSMDAEQSPSENQVLQKKQKSQRRSDVEETSNSDFLKKNHEMKREPEDESGRNEEAPRKKKKRKEKSN